jgi:hypothetical protein
MSAQYCPEAFPPEELEAGPFVLAAFEQLSDSQVNRNPWEEVAAAPIVGRYAHASAWTSEHVLIWGGIHKSSDVDPELADGARYSPQQDLWRMLPPAPEGMSGSAQSVWTGDRWLVRTDHAPNGPVQMASYDPIADQWTEIDSSPLTPGEGYAMTWTGQDVVFWGGHGGDFLIATAPVAYNPETATWHEYPEPPIAPRTSPVVAWTGSELLFWGGKASCSGGDSTCTEFASDGAAYNPETGTWRMIPANSDLPANTPVRGSAWIGTEMVLLYAATCTGEPCLAAFAYNPTLDLLRNLPALEGVETLVGTPVWIESEGFRSYLYVFDTSGAGYAYHQVDDTWTALGEYPDMERYWATMVAVGPQVMVWGGWSGAAADDPLSNGFLTIP